MAVSFSAVEEAVRCKVRDHFYPLLTDSRCVTSNIDRLLRSVLEEDADYGCLLEYAGGKNQASQPFTKPVWAWAIDGIFFIRFDGDPDSTEVKLRQVLDKMPTLFEDDRRLGNLVALATISEMGEPEPGTLNDVPFYALYFSIEVVIPVK